MQEPEGFLASFQEWEKLKELGWLTQRFSRSRSKRVKHTILVGTSLFAVIAVATLSPTAHARGSWKTARILACKDKEAGDSCSYEKKGTTVEGTCKTTPRKKLICTTNDTGASEATGGPMNGSSGGAGGGGEAPASTP